MKKGERSYRSGTAKRAERAKERQRKNQQAGADRCRCCPGQRRSAGQLEPAAGAGMSLRSSQERRARFPSGCSPVSALLASGGCGHGNTGAPGCSTSGSGKRRSAAGQGRTGEQERREGKAMERGKGPGWPSGRAPDPCKKPKGKWHRLCPANRFSVLRLLSQPDFPGVFSWASGHLPHQQVRVTGSPIVEAFLALIWCQEKPPWDRAPNTCTPPIRILAHTIC